MPDVSLSHHDVFDDSDSFHSSLGAPRKPVILAGNALQLELDEPDNPFTTDDVLVSPYTSSPDTSPQRPRAAPTDAAANPAPTPTPPASSITGPAHNHLPVPVPVPVPARVRFRSRVRITSGLRHHRNRDPDARSIDSSGSDSPSSSISAPLRYHADDSVRGPLGQRLSVLAANAWQRRRLAAAVTQNGAVYASQHQGQDQPQGVPQPDERTALLDRRRTSPYVGARTGTGTGTDRQLGVGEDVGEDDDEQDEDAYLMARREEEDITFGRWPWRLFNRHVRVQLHIHIRV
ncbi:hypothetical protein EVG20_g10161 [Dentipellis fragilis]|uniref:Uncharacterized protein n=1 Tax=Dentipellis fragilis TaxID=205917 RepID=A0A4Y9XSQ5_9AGAM|nr:hypothetical protein EVG20_g10161 [Dentipellis fragilis]